MKIVKIMKIMDFHANPVMFTISHGIHGPMRLMGISEKSMSLGKVANSAKTYGKWENMARKQGFAVYICCPGIPRSFFFSDQRDGSQSFEIRSCFQVLGRAGGKYLAREP